MPQRRSTLQHLCSNAVQLTYHPHPPFCILEDQTCIFTSQDSRFFDFPGNIKPLPYALYIHTPIYTYMYVYNFSSLPYNHHCGGWGSQYFQSQLVKEVIYGLSSAISGVTLSSVSTRLSMKWWCNYKSLVVVYPSLSEAVYDDYSGCLKNLVPVNPVDNECFSLLKWPFWAYTLLQTHPNSTLLSYILSI